MRVVFRVILVCLGVVLGLLSACAKPEVVRPTKKPPTPIVVSEPLDEDLGLLVRAGSIRLQLLEGWEPSGGRGWIWEDRNDIREGVRASGVLHIQSVPRADTRKNAEIQAEMLAEFKKRSPEVQTVVSSERLEVSAGDAWVVYTTREEHRRVFGVLQAIVFRGQEVYFLTYSAEERAFLRDRGLFEKSLRSVRP